VTEQKTFSRASLVFFFFSSPTHKILTGIGNRWETTNSKPQGPIILDGQSKTGTSSQILFHTLFIGIILSIHEGR
jgi:hypothetical protein